MAIQTGSAMSIPIENVILKKKLFILEAPIRYLYKIELASNYPNILK